MSLEFVWPPWMAQTSSRQDTLYCVEITVTPDDTAQSLTAPLFPGLALSSSPLLQLFYFALRQAWHRDQQRLVLVTASSTAGGRVAQPSLAGDAAGAVDGQGRLGRTGRSSSAFFLRLRAELYGTAPGSDHGDIALPAAMPRFARRSWTRMQGFRLLGTK